MIKSKEIPFEANRASAFVLKCVAITNISMKHYQILSLDNNKKQNKQKMKHKHSLKD